MEKNIKALPTHPGELLADEIEYAGLSMEDAARKLDISVQELQALTRGEVPISEKVAKNADMLFNLESGMLLQLQYDRDEIAEKIEVYNEFYNYSEKLHDKGFDSILANLKKILFNPNRAAAL
ncbi:MAG: hypothetical protein K6F33_00725 [Bacteroidales bacterium]|nr:hypothetical protein [Bacteroidales bacterium]